MRLQSEEECHGPVAHGLDLIYQQKSSSMHRAWFGRQSHLFYCTLAHSGAAEIQPLSLVLSSHQTPMPFLSLLMMDRLICLCYQLSVAPLHPQNAQEQLDFHATINDLALLECQLTSPVGGLNDLGLTAKCFGIPHLPDALYTAELHISEARVIITVKGHDTTDGSGIYFSSKSYYILRNTILREIYNTLGVLKRNGYLLKVICKLLFPELSDTSQCCCWSSTACLFKQSCRIYQKYNILSIDSIYREYINYRI